MTTAQPDSAAQALHEDLFETQISLQTRLLDYIEQADEFHVLDEAWEEFTNYDQREMDPEDPEPVLHFFPWALFYWRRDVPESQLEAARGELLDEDTDIDALDDEVEDNDQNWPDDLDDEAIDKVLSEVFGDSAEDGVDLDDDELDDGLDDDENYITLPPIAMMFMNSVDGADGPESRALEQTLTPRDRAFIEAASTAPYSFFKVLAVGPGAFVTLEDLMVSNVVNVYAPALVDTSEVDDIIYAQVVSLENANLLCGVAPAVLPVVVEEPLAEARARIEELVQELGDDWRYDLEFELRALYQQMVDSMQQQMDEDGEGGEGGEGGDVSMPPTKH